MTRARMTTRLRGGLILLASLLASSRLLAAPGCPGNPSALGTSRTLVVDPREHPRIGTMQYAETLPLADKEVVLTFDDGPLPKYSDQVLDILAAECIKATFFVVGIMAKEHPEGVRRLRDAGHTIGTHTQHHPIFMKRMPISGARVEIDHGIAATTEALGGQPPAPFFRIPGLSRVEATEDYAASLGLQVWSADFLADDWRHISPEQVYELAMERIAAKGKGILLLHDIQARTVAALPMILRDLKINGYRIVHVVPARTNLPATPTEPQQWRTHPAYTAARRPAIPGFASARSETLPIPITPQTGMPDGALMLLPEPFDRVKRLALTPLAPPSLRPPSAAVASSGFARLPATGALLFRMPDTAPPPTLADNEIRFGLPPVDANTARRSIPGSAPVTRQGLHR